MSPENEQPATSETPTLGALLVDPQPPTRQEQQIQELQDALEAEKDARKEERFVFLVAIILLLDIVFFTVMPTFGGPLAMLILQLLILVPLANKMGMQEIAAMFDRVLSRIAGKAAGD